MLWETSLTPSSCFPIVPKIAKHHLALPDTTPLTLLGGLTSFGGAGNNYSMHAFTEMTRQLRQRKSAGVDSNGLILANGGVMTYQHVVILSSGPRKDGTSYPSANALSANLPIDPVPTIEEEAKGEAIIEVSSILGFRRSNFTPIVHAVLEYFADKTRPTLSNTPETASPIVGTLLVV